MDFTGFAIVTQQYHTEWWIILWNNQFINSTGKYFHLSQNVNDLDLFQQMSAEKHLKLK